MALYAFDGTWNEDEKEDIGESNVRKFLDAYHGANYNDNYIEGVGTRFGMLGRVLGGVFGIGGRTRIEEMYDLLVNNWQRGDHSVDIIGFSRGAAMAVHFANLVAERGVVYDGVRESPDIRFLGVWDIVGSFGIPINFVLNFHDYNIGYDISTVSPKVKNCYHALAIHERRQTFEPTRLNIGNQHAHIEEVWFRGVHSDVGGGNDNVKLSNITLAWMLKKASQHGLPIEPDKLEYYQTHQDPTAPINENFDIVKNRRRRIHAGDTIHESAQGRKLAIDESATCLIGSTELYSWTGIEVEAGCHYTFVIAPQEQWRDKHMTCGPEGWETEELPWYKEELVEFLEYKRRCPHANWFELIGSVGEDGRELFRIGKGGSEATYTVRESGLLYGFANDVKMMYFNNHGAIRVTVTRVAEGRTPLSFFDGART